MEDKYTTGVYSRNTLEFVTVGAETCLFLEDAGSFSKSDFMQRALRILPLLYLKASLTDCPDALLDEEPERFVTEHDYEVVKNSISQVLGTADRYLEVFHPDIQLSETGIATDVSEDLADIYQDLKDFLLCYQIGNEEVMNDALATCLGNFKTFWGQRLVNCLRALHNAFYMVDEPGEETVLEDDDYEPDMKKNFLTHQHSETLDAFLNKLDDQDAN